jgi:hypothetical protein
VCQWYDPNISRPLVLRLRQPHNTVAVNRRNTNKKVRVYRMSARGRTRHSGSHRNERLLFGTADHLLDVRLWRVAERPKVAGSGLSACKRQVRKADAQFRV